MTSLTLAASIVLGGTFALAAIGKLCNRASRDELAAAIAGMRLARPARARRLALAVAALELAVPALLLLPGAGRIGLALAGALCAAFAAAVAAAVSRGADLSCRCFGAEGGRLGPVHVARNGALAGLAVVALAAPAGPAVGTGMAVATAAVALLLVVVVVSLDELAEGLAGSRLPLGRNPT